MWFAWYYYGRRTFAYQNRPNIDRDRDRVRRHNLFCRLLDWSHHAANFCACSFFRNIFVNQKPAEIQSVRSKWDMRWMVGQRPIQNQQEKNSLFATSLPCVSFCFFCFFFFFPFEWAVGLVLGNAHVQNTMTIGKCAMSWMNFCVVKMFYQFSATDKWIYYLERC